MINKYANMKMILHMRPICMDGCVRVFACLFVNSMQNKHFSLVRLHMQSKLDQMFSSLNNIKKNIASQKKMRNKRNRFENRVILQNFVIDSKHFRYNNIPLNLIY